jgi:hypothetical protein
MIFRVLKYLVLVLPIISFSQIKQNWGIEIGGRIGVLSPHRPVMKHLPNSLIVGQDLSIYKDVSGNKYWHKVYNTPKIGLTIYHSSLGNDEVLGKSFGATSWIEFPFINTTHHCFGLNLRLGLAYINKPFDLIKNPTNTAISSNLNCLAIGGIRYLYTFDKLSIGTRLELTHFSNAALKAPNLGLNSFQLSLTAGYHFSSKKLNLTLTKIDKKDSISKRNYFYVVGFKGSKQLFNHLGINYPVTGGTFSFQHIFKLPVGIELGFDIMQNKSELQLLQDKNIELNDYIKTGAYLGYVLTLDRIHFLVAMGHYIHDPYNLNDRLYHRIGMRYVLLNRFVLNLTLKSHWGNADYAEFGVGMRF